MPTRRAAARASLRHGYCISQVYATRYVVVDMLIDDDECTSLSRTREQPPALAAVRIAGYGIVVC